MFHLLPDEIFLWILHFVPGQKVAQCARVCSRFLRVCRDPRAFHALTLRGTGADVLCALPNVAPCTRALHTLRVLGSRVGPPEDFWFGGGCKSVVATKAISRYLGVIPTLRKLVLSCYAELGHVILGHAPQMCPALTELVLINSATAENIRYTVDALVDLSALRILRIEEIAPSIIASLPASLRRLDVGTGLADNLRGIRTLAAACPSLEYLDVGDTNSLLSGADLLLGIAEAFPNLHHVTLRVPVTASVVTMGALRLCRQLRSFDFVVRVTWRCPFEKCTEGDLEKVRALFTPTHAKTIYAARLQVHDGDLDPCISVSGRCGGSGDLSIGFD